MSFYEGRPRRSGYMDVHETPVVTADGRPAKAPDPIDWTSRRRSSPAERLLPIAERWSASLPEALRPRQLIAQYPRIANLIALQWEDVAARGVYFDELLIDRRGNRQGFPRGVLNELVRLRNHGYGREIG